MKTLTSELQNKSVQKHTPINLTATTILGNINTQIPWLFHSSRNINL